MQLKMLADKLGLALHGDEECNVQSLAPVSKAGRGQLTFVVGVRWVEALKKTQADAVILPPSMLQHAPCNALISDNPYLSYSQVSHLLYPEPQWEAGSHHSAIIDPDAQVSPSARIGAHAVVEKGAVIGDRTFIGPGCVIGEDAVIAAGCYLAANVTVYNQCQLGVDCRLHAGVVIGADGFGYAPSAKGWSRIKQVGKVVIGDRVEIGANTTIDRGAIEDTIIGDGVILDNQIQIAHNVKIGTNTAIAACVGIAGSTTIGENCTIGGKSAIVGHLHIANNVHLTATSFVTQSISEKGSYSSGMPLQPTKQWRRTYARLGQLEDWIKSIKKLTKQASPR